MFRRTRVLAASLAAVTIAGSLAERARAECLVGWWWPPQVRVEPAAPEQGETITVTAFGIWPDTCVPTASDYHLVNAEIRFDVLLDYLVCDRLCGDSPTPWELSITIDSLEAGTYSICASLFDPPCQSEACTPCDPIGSLVVYCPGDINGDGMADLSDLAIQLAHFGQAGIARTEGDLDNDGDVDLSDLAELLANFGLAC
jgi:hypothetical protein